MQYRASRTTCIDEFYYTSYIPATLHGSTSNSLIVITMIAVLASSMNSSLQDNTIILAATVASSAFVVILIITTAAISVLSLMIILIWKRNTNKKSQHPVSTDENVCYTTSNSLIEDSKEYVYKWYNNTVLCHIMICCIIDIDHDQADRSDTAEHSLQLTSYLQHVSSYLVCMPSELKPKR